MLEELDIQNFALIDKAHVDFSDGFTVLSGETGAGKSILIGSLAFLLGGKGGTELIRTGCHEALVSGTFLLESKDANAWLEEHGIESEDNRILLRRVVRDTGKSSAWIGSTPVTKADLALFAAFLVDIHGQHDQQSLMKVSEHRRFLDSYAGIVDEVHAFTQLYAQLAEKQRTLESLVTNEADRANRIEMLTFAINEIAEAKLRAGEDEELAAEEAKMASFEKLYSDVEEINAALDGSSSGFGESVLSLLRRLKSVVPHASSLDKELENLDDRLQSVFYEVDDIAKEFRSYASRLVFDPERLSQVQERLDLMFKLKKKYASSTKAPVQEVLDYAQNAQVQLDALTDSNADKSALEAQIAQLEKQVYAAAKTISQKRKAASQKMSQAVVAILAELGMKEARFEVNLAEKPGTSVTQKCNPYGMDDVEFLISANPGTPLAPLAKIASGGELSRVMLALKTILSNADTVSTLIFDEIDTGIGGEVAVAVGNHMKRLASSKQILCITHLASIAVYAHHQIKIKKGSEGQSTQTLVFPVDGEERVKEIARMLSGDSGSAQSLEHAAALLQKFGG